MEEREDCIIIGPPNELKQNVLGLIIIAPLCLIDWILEWIGMGESDKITSTFITTFWIITLIAIIFDANKQYRIDNSGVSRILFQRFVKYISWDDMKYIGICTQPIDIPSRVSKRRAVMLFSKISLTAHKKFHFIVSRCCEERNYISILLQYIDDETYEKILEFSGGERNIP